MLWAFEQSETAEKDETPKDWGEMADHCLACGALTFWGHVADDLAEFEPRAKAEADHAA
jgi:hypothetical protein